MRFAFFCVLVVLCGCTTVIVVVNDGGDGVDAGTKDASSDNNAFESSTDASDAGADSPIVDAGCDGTSALPNFSKFDDCQYISNVSWNPQVPYCPSCAPQYAYACAQQTMPNLQGCVKLDYPNGGSQYCCPTPECHRLASYDAPSNACGDGGVYKTVYAFACPKGKTPPTNFCQAGVNWTGILDDDVLCCSQK